MVIYGREENKEPDNPVDEMETRELDLECPHCRRLITAKFECYVVTSHSLASKIQYLGHDKKYIGVMTTACGSCYKPIVRLEWGTGLNNKQELINPKNGTIVFPPKEERKPAPEGVPDEYLEDYNEALAILDASPKSSAALSRRCLQHLIHNEENIQERTLFQEIETLIATKRLPYNLANGLHVIRSIGNFAAHAKKSTVSDQIIPVEKWEAEWLLDLIYQLFTYYFVEPSITQGNFAKLNIKLVEMNKPEVQELDKDEYYGRNTDPTTPPA